MGCRPKNGVPFHPPNPPFPALPLLTSGHPTKGPVFLHDSCLIKGQVAQFSSNIPTFHLFSRGKKKTHLLFRVDYNVDIVMLVFREDTETQKLSDLPSVTLLITNRDDVQS